MGSVWLATAWESLRAGRLLRGDCPRSSVSRCYYAAYAACSGWLEHQGVDPGRTAHGLPRDNYAHEHLPRLLREQMMWDEARWPRQLARDLEMALSRLHKARTIADYDPAEDVSGSVEPAIRDAALVVSELGQALRGDADE